MMLCQVCLGYHIPRCLGSKTSPLCSCPFSALGGSSALHIPAFPGGGCLIDYVPQVCHLLTNKVKASPLTSVTCESPLLHGRCTSDTSVSSASALPTLKDTSSVPPTLLPPFLRTQLPLLVLSSSLSLHSGDLCQLLEFLYPLHFWCILCLLMVLHLWTPFSPVIRCTHMSTASQCQDNSLKKPSFFSAFLSHPLIVCPSFLSCLGAAVDQSFCSSRRKNSGSAGFVSTRSNYLKFSLSCNQEHIAEFTVMAVVNYFPKVWTYTC